MFDLNYHSEKEIFRPFGMEARLAGSKVACVALKWRLVTIDKSKHYVTNQYHPERNTTVFTRVIFYVRRIGLYLFKYRIYGTISIYILKGIALVYQLVSILHC